MTEAVDVRHRLAAHPRSASEARRILREMLRPARDEELLTASELALSELVTNAVLHAHTDIDVHLQWDGTELRIEVLDRSDFLPALPDPGHLAEAAVLNDAGDPSRIATTGRGMELVAALSTQHGVTPTQPKGKIVWCVLRTGSESSSGSNGWSTADSKPPARAGYRSVTLMGFPPTLWLAAAEQHDAALREAALMQGAVSAPALAAADRARFAISQALQHALDDATENGRAVDPLPAGHPSTLAAVPTVLNLSLSVGPSAANDFNTLQDVLDMVQRRSIAGQMLTAPALAEVVAVRDWAAEQVITLLAGEAGRAWPGVTEASVPTFEPDAGLSPEQFTDLAQGSARVIVVDQHNRIAGVSETLAQEIGWTLEELVGRRVVVLIPTRFRESHIAGFTRHLTTGVARALDVDLELPVLLRDGSEQPYAFRIHAHAATSSSRPVYVAALQPLH